MRLLSKEKIFVFFYAILFLFFSSCVSAIGISPADVYVNFVPNHEYIIDYSVDSGRDFEFYIQGPFSNFASVEKLSSSDKRSVFRVYLKLPEDYEIPGKHRMYVAAKEKSAGGTVSAVAAIRAFVEIDVPYPGYYSEMKINVRNVNQGEPVTINVNLQNKGKLNISDAKVTLNVLSDEKTIKTFESQKIAMKPTESSIFTAVIPGDDLKPGKYKVNAELLYEGKPQSVSSEFRVGIFDIQIVNYTYFMYNNSVNLFEIDIESLWNNVIKTVYMDLSIKKNNKTLSTIKTPPFDLSPWQIRRSSLYWNTKDVPIGNYTLEIALHYEDEVKIINKEISIVETIPPIIERPIPTSTIIVAVIAIIIIIFNIVTFIKRRRNKKE